MTDFRQRLIRGAERTGNLLCLGLDPVPERIERVLGEGTVEAAEAYLEGILQYLDQAGQLPSTLKPNAAYFEQYGSQGWALLEKLMARWSSRCFIILDAKRGDIGRSSEAYARSAFEHLKADAVTVSPWMGKDSVEPFLARGPAQGSYLLLRTSNPGHQDLQRESWEKLASQIVTWGPGCGVVVGATAPEDLGRALKLLPTTPLLIPGVGTQGGDGERVLELLRSQDEARVHRVNVSSGILFAGEAEPDLDYRESARRATEKFAKLTRLSG